MCLSDYELLGLFGRGGQGKVYNAKRKSDGLTVVIKKVKKDIFTTLCNNIPTEIKLLEKVQNIEGVIQMLDFIIEENFFYIVMEKIEECVDLFDFISKYGGLEEKLTKKMFHSIVKTNILCRESNIYHRDIKDENILVDLKSNNVKLIDFGHACEHNYKEEPEKMFKTFYGTDVYKPPEYILNEKYNLDIASVWCLGILLYDMLCGDIPFETNKEICSGKLIFTKELKLSDEARDLIEQCLKINQEKRISLDNILSHVWFKIDEKKS